jgi:hypothetical protein
VQLKFNLFFVLFLPHIIIYGSRIRQLAEAEAEIVPRKETRPVVHSVGQVQNITGIQRLHGVGRQAAGLRAVRMVQPHPVGGDAVGGRQAVEYQRAQAVHGKTGIAPAAVAHQVLREVAVETSLALNIQLRWIRKITWN